MGTQVITIENLRSLAFGGISGTYVQVGTGLLNPCKLICFTNNTDGDMFFSDDGVNNKLFVAASSFKLFDCDTNRLGSQIYWVFATGTQFWVKQSTAPTKGAVYIEVLG